MDRQTDSRQKHGNERCRMRCQCIELEYRGFRSAAKLPALQRLPIAGLFGGLP